MPTANEVIVDALRKINVPGRGSVLSGEDTDTAFRALQDILNAKAVSKLFQPGIRRHFFALQSAKAIYTYGPGREFDTDDFDDPAPIKIEDAYVREGTSIVDNQQVDEPKFAAVGTWSAGTGWTIANNKATIATGNSGAVLSQTLALTAGRTYVLKVDITQRDSSVLVEVLQDATAILTFTAAGSGITEREIGFTGSASTVRFTATDADSDLDVNEVSIVEKGKEKKSLPDSVGSDYSITIIDQKRYNDRFTKGTGGRPYEILFSRQFDHAEIRFDNSAILGDILVMDVLVNQAQITKTSDTIRLNPEAMEWLKFRLAHSVAGEYGKALTRDQKTIMDEAWNNLAASNYRANRLRVDKALRERPTFDINRGDP